jgi:ElaB/YqjD/DUF883 family membrane-anchored ribosome-binding protein
LKYAELWLVRKWREICSYKDAIICWLTSTNVKYFSSTHVKEAIMAESNLMRNKSKPDANTGYRPEGELRSTMMHQSGESQLNANRVEGDMEASSADHAPYKNRKEFPQEMNEDQIDVDYETLKRDLERIRNDVTKIATRFAENKQNVVKGFAEDLAREGQSLLETAKSHSVSLAKSASETSKQAATNVEAKIQERPFMSIVISFLAGLILAKLMNRN